MTSSAESDSSHDRMEHPTGLRYSLANARIGSTDFFVEHTAGKVRLISYPRPKDKAKHTIGEVMSAEGLILGVQMPTEDQEQDVYRIPSSSRPIRYDSSSVAQGAFSYGDDRLFYDLGVLLGSAQSMGFVLEENIIDSVAFVEYGHTDDNQVYFIPGIEYLTDFNLDGEDHLDYYAGTLEQEFGNRFREAVMYFRMGFKEAIAEE